MSAQIVDIPNGSTTIHAIVHPPSTATATATATATSSTSKDDDSSIESIILLHGGPGVPEPFVELAAILTTKFQVITFQQRGTGKSFNPSRDYSMEAYISDIDVIADHFGLTKFHLFGHSWGGLYAQIYAHAYPERLYTLFLSSPSSGTNELWAETEKEVLAYNQRNSSSWEFLKMGIYSLVGALGYDWGVQSLFQLVLAVYHRNHAPSMVVVDSASCEPIKADPINQTRPKILAYKPLSTIVDTAPYDIMLCYGDADIYGSSQEKSLARYPTARTEIIKDCGHIPWIHNPTQFEEILRSFYAIQ